MIEFEEKNNDVERIIIDLKNQIQESKEVEKKSRMETQEKRARTVKVRS